MNRTPLPLNVTLLPRRGEWVRTSVGPIRMPMQDPACGMAPVRQRYQQLLRYTGGATVPGRLQDKGHEL